MRRPSSSNSSAADVIEMPRSCSSAIQSEVAWRRALRPRTAPASSIAPAYSNSFSVSVVLPASGCEMIANVRRLDTSRSSSPNADGTSDFRRSGKGSERRLTSSLYSVATLSPPGLVHLGRWRISIHIHLVQRVAARHLSRDVDSHRFPVPPLDELLLAKVSPE